MTEVTKALLNMYEKHKEYLEKQIEMHDYLDNEFRVRSGRTHAERSDAYKMALDNLKSLFGEEE